MYGKSLAKSAINWCCPLNRGLISCHVIRPGPYVSSARMLDLTGNNRTAAYSAGATPSMRSAPGSKGSVLFDVDAICGSFEIPSSMAQTFTVSFWLYMDTASGTIIYNTYGAWRVQRFQNKLTLTVPGVADNKFSGLSNMVAGQWYFIAVTLSGTTATGYLDTASEAITITAPTGSQTTFMWGDNSLASGTAGVMSEFRLYDRVLGVSEIMQLRASQMSGGGKLYNWLPKKKYFGTSVSAPAVTISPVLKLGDSPHLVLPGTLLRP